MNINSLECHRSILLVGEGNFTFTQGLISLFSENNLHKIQLTSTSLDEKDYVCNRYLDGSQDFFEVLEQNPYCDIFHGVDATQLERCFMSQRFDLIIFNFPHHAGKGKIQKNRQLLEAFFKSGKTVLAPDDVDDHSMISEIKVTLAKGQGGTEADEEQRIWGNSWQVVEQGAKAGLVLKGVDCFDSQLWHDLGYRCCGRRSQGVGNFATDGALVHTFVREGIGVPCMYPVQHIHDISFWYGEISREDFIAGNMEAPPFDEDSFLQIVHNHTQGFLQSIEFQEIYFSQKQNERSNNHKVSRSYRLCYSSQDDRSLSRQKSVKLQDALRSAIEESGIGSFKG
mmetsp:Transcript_25451/g.33235  ORF Transcript_25451/g.33235 Transcript_25451/m.33235 type:complete len:340 (-) Transcript_25451:375-1394(-)